MEIPGFQIHTDAHGNLSVAEGVVVDRGTGAVTVVGGDVAGINVAGESTQNFAVPRPVSHAKEMSFVGGSGRNVIVTGPAAIAGIYRPTRPNKWVRGGFTLEVTGASAATISDADDIIAELTTGGEAPAGDYDSTTYGESRYNGSASFTAEGTKETGWPGGYVNIEVEISEGTARAGRYTSADGVTWEHEEDADWTFTVAEDGSAEFAYDGTVIATRANGANDDPCGLYLATEAGLSLNPEAPEVLEDEPSETNPFGTLTLKVAWGGAPDLDIGCTFLGATVGFGHSASSDYMTWTGDDTSAAGDETVAVNLAQAWTDGQITNVADVMMAVDWYPPRNGSGPATLTVTYDPPGSSGTPVDYIIHPGSVTPSTTPAVAVRVTAAGVAELVGSDWFATVSGLRRPTVAGTAFITINQAGGVVAGVTGPFFSASLPAPEGDLVSFPLGTSDGAGKIKQVHTGPLLWAIASGGGGAAFEEITEDDFIALDPPDSGTYYDITDLLP